MIDLRDAERGPAARADFLHRLRRAVHDIGFFQLVGHRVTGAAELLELSRKFFALPDEERRALDILDSPHFRGYSELGRERTRGIPDQRQQLDIGPERPSSAPGPGEPAYRWLVGPNQWPAGLPALRPAVVDWMDRLTGLSHRLLRLILESLEAPADFLDAVVDPDPQVHFKLLHYPGPDPSADPGPADQGAGVHKDLGLLTLLVQDRVGGLQVAVEDDRFVDVPVVPDAFVVNLGELLEVATRGYLRATVHRVVRPAPGVDRYSMPFFYSPRLEAAMRPLPTRYVSEAGGVVADPDNPLFACYGENVMKGLTRAFPELIARHHPGLLAAADR
ncbi:isopenicillin N synthase family oxygenase [Streptomyces sp. MRC013]|uniref:isopenicillin N synthase family dioxygenase n=1 Tax=Streptomyces sp. MRC013 TaxID=2898276 RepID=UPI0020270AB6|nr:2-oxoglutarate and iron-dependent oxygenase domain-containing protein [Streptomyces sp. MRC013]URM88717.1 isopenicillin N synthase family oxygenase [Streptomyces sp. MRC013]